MHTPTDPIVIVSDDPAFGSTLQHQLEEEGHAATVQRADESTPERLAAQHPGLLVVHAADVEGTSATAGSIAEKVQQTPGIEDVPVVVCADHRTLRQEAIKDLAQHRGTVVASSCQADEVRAKLHDLDAHPTH